MQELIGVVIDHYSILRHLAHGGMSEIFLAQHLHTNELVVIKMVHRSHAEYSERFRLETKTMLSLHHPNILPILAYGEYKEWSYLVAPYIKSGTLHDRLNRGSLSLKEVGIVLKQLSSALYYAHGQGVIHRDIKPSNILLQDGRHIYLADFGLTRKVGETNNLTATGYLIGTPEYMAPELADEPASVSSDLYALGILLYQMLTGKVPFTAKTPVATFLKHVSEWPQRPSDLNKNLPKTLDDMVLRTLEKVPAYRYKTALEISNAYDEALLKAEQRLPATIRIVRKPGGKQPLIRPRNVVTAATLAAVLVFGIALNSIFNQPLAPQAPLTKTNRVLAKENTPVPTNTPMPSPTIVATATVPPDDTPLQTVQQQNITSPPQQQNSAQSQPESNTQTKQQSKTESKQQKQQAKQESKSKKKVKNSSSNQTKTQKKAEKKSSRPKKSPPTKNNAHSAHAKQKHVNHGNKHGSHSTKKHASQYKNTAGKEHGNNTNHYKNKQVNPHKNKKYKPAQENKRYKSKPAQAHKQKKSKGKGWK